MEGNDDNDDQKIPLFEGAVKRKFTCPRCPYFLAKIDDFHLESALSKSVTGGLQRRSLRFPGTIFLSLKFNASTHY